jgi:hypothetical protein
LKNEKRKSQICQGNEATEQTRGAWGGGVVKTCSRTPTMEHSMGNGDGDMSGPQPGTTTCSVLYNPHALATFFSVVDKDLQCPICLDFMNKPVSLACAHSFCKHCITKALEFKERCPVCKQECKNKRKVRHNDLFEHLIKVVKSFPRDILPDGPPPAPLTLPRNQDTSGCGDSKPTSHRPSQKTAIARQESNIEILAEMFGPGDMIEVGSRMGPGMNKPGGIGTVKKVDLDRHCLDVKYVLGGMDTKVPFHICKRKDVYKERERRQTPTKRSGEDSSSYSDWEVPRSPSYTQITEPRKMVRKRPRPGAVHTSSGGGVLVTSSAAARVIASTTMKPDHVERRHHKSNLQSSRQQRTTSQQSHKGDAHKVQCPSGAARVVRIYCSNVNEKGKESIHRLSQEAPPGAAVHVLTGEVTLTLTLTLALTLTLTLTLIQRSTTLPSKPRT